MQAMLGIVYVILPVIMAGIVHSIVIRFNLIPQLARPLDFGACLRGQPLLGANKTFRGVIIMMAGTALSAWALSYLLPGEQLPGGFGLMTQPGPASMAGLIMGLGYSLGELPNSFIKRRLRVPPGGRPAGATRALFYFADQMESVIGVVILLWAVYAPAYGVLLALLVTGGLVHILFDVCLYLFGVKHGD